MKRKILCVFLLFLCFRPSPAITSPLNLLQDGGFETWDTANILSHWKNQGTNSSLIQQPGGRLGTAGDYYPQLEITFSEDYDDILETSIGTVTPSTVLNASIYMRSNVYNGKINVEVNWYIDNVLDSSETLITYNPGFGMENLWILVFPENDSYGGALGTKARTVPSGINNATISLRGYETKRSPSGSASPQQPYYVWLDDLTLFGSAMDEFTPTTSVVVFLIVTSIVTVVLVRKKSRSPTCGRIKK